MRLKGRLCEAEFDELLLLHELRVGAVVYDIRTEDGRGELAVDLLGIYIFEFAVKDKVVPRNAQIYSGLLPEEDKGKDVAILLPLAGWRREGGVTNLLPAGEEEGIRVEAIGNSIA